MDPSNTKSTIVRQMEKENEMAHGAAEEATPSTHSMQYSTHSMQYSTYCTAQRQEWAPLDLRPAGSLSL